MNGTEKISLLLQECLLLCLLPLVVHLVLECGLYQEDLGINTTSVIERAMNYDYDVTITKFKEKKHGCKERHLMVTWRITKFEMSLIFNRPVSCINYNLNSSMFQLTSLPWNKSCVGALFERLLYLSNSSEKILSLDPKRRAKLNWKAEFFEARIYCNDEYIWGAKFQDKTAHISPSQSCCAKPNLPHKMKRIDKENHWCFNWDDTF